MWDGMAGNDLLCLFSDVAVALALFLDKCCISTVSPLFVRLDFISDVTLFLDWNIIMTKTESVQTTFEPA
jgi:hypothetical protein